MGHSPAEDTIHTMGDFMGHWVTANWQGKSNVFGNVRLLRTMQTMNIYLVSLLPPSATTTHNYL